MYQHFRFLYNWYKNRVFTFVALAINMLCSPAKARSDVSLHLILIATPMTSTNIITHVELHVRPDFLAEVLPVAKQTQDAIQQEAGCEKFLLMTKAGAPNVLVIFAVYTSRATYDWHLEQAYVKEFFAFLQGKLLAAPNATELVEV
jgi:quinol monooxygenase YgiN